MNILNINDIKNLIHDKNKVCIFVGAGASIMPPTCLPSFRELNSALLLNLCQSTSMVESLQPILEKIKTKPEQQLQIKILLVLIHI